MSERLFEIVDALKDPALLGAALGPYGTWETWFVILKSTFGLPLDAAEAKIFREVAGNRKPPSAPVRELWAVAGRRSGKSRVAAAINAYAGALAAENADNGLAKGETGWILSFAPVRAQAKTILEYTAAFFDESPILGPLVVDRTSEELRLKNNIVIATHVSSYRSLRGRTVLAATLDEAAFFKSEESASPDVEVVRALKPSLRPGALLVGISSPFGRRGLLYERHRASFGRDDPQVLVVQADTRKLNPTYSQEIIDEAMGLDPVSARTEYGATFRTDISNYINETILRRCVREHQAGDALPDRAFRYFGFVDSSGGVGDSFTCAIAHIDGEKTVLDEVHEFEAPFAPPDVVDAIAEILEGYGVSSVHGDRYAAEWVASAFRERGLHYLPSEASKSQLYAECLPIFTSGTAVLPNHPKLIAQLCSLERRAAASGREVIDHPRGLHDDVANAVAGALVVTNKTRRRQLNRRPLVVEGVGDYDVMSF